MFYLQRRVQQGEDRGGCVRVRVCVSSGAISYWEQWWREVGMVVLGKAQADGGYKSKGTGGKKRENKTRVISLKAAFLDSSVANVQTPLCVVVHSQYFTHTPCCTGCNLTNDSGHLDLSRIYVNQLHM